MFLGGWSLPISSSVAASAPASADASAPSIALAPSVTLTPHDTPTGPCASQTDINDFNSNFSVTFTPYPNIGYANVPAVNVSQFDPQIALTITVTPTGQAQGVSILQALLTVWATGWNNGTLSSTPPTAPAIWNLPITNGTQATGILNDMKYFPPGAHVYFNLTITSAPTYTQVYSPCPAGPDPTWAKNKPEPTWQYIVAGGWPSSAFLSDIQLTAFPDIFHGVYPGPFQPVTITMTSVGGSTVPIGGANIYYNVTYTDTLTNNISKATGGQAFTPGNSTTAHVSVGPYYSVGNLTTIQFYIKAWTLWSGGAVNFIKSPSYNYPVTSGGTWCNTNYTFYHFLSLSTAPYSNITAQNNSVVPAGQPVNVSVESNFANTTIAYAYLHFREVVKGQSNGGSVSTMPMYRANATTQYTGDNFNSITHPPFGPFQPGSTITFWVEAFDNLRCSITSRQYTFHTSPAPPAIVNGRTYFYVVAYDLGTHSYVSGARVQFANHTWVDNTSTNALGFAYPNASASNFPVYLRLNQTYNVTVVWDGQTQFVQYQLTATSNKTLTFYFNSHHTVPPVYSQSVFPFPPAVIVGMILATAIVGPIYLLWQEIRRKAEAEEKRVTL
jgi:hypothetical protein